MSKSDKCALACILLYILMGFVTNSYVNVYRYNDWEKIENSDVDAKVGLSSVFWPVYWTSRLTTYMVENIPNISIKINGE